MASAPIVLLTDFGTQDTYAGVLKGVIAKVAPDVPVIDLTHGLPPYQILSAAFELYRAYTYFPKESIFVCVVDPGVGSSRKALLAKTKDYTFIAPDNGLLTMVLAAADEFHLFHLKSPQGTRRSLSQTFDGRDLFAPAAADLANGVDVLTLGMPSSRYKKLPQCFPQLKKTKQTLEAQGCILHIDHYGNAITNFSKTWIEKNFSQKKIQAAALPKLQLGFSGTQRKPLTQWATHYQAISNNKPHLLFGSSGFLEIACREKSAAAALKLKNSQSLKLTKRSI